jgi:hypothetical protein
MVFEVVRVILFGFIKNFEGFNLCHYWCIPDFRRVEFLNFLRSYYFLLIGVVENYGSVLRAHIMSLPVHGSWVVGSKEYIKDFLKSARALIH